MPLFSPVGSSCLFKQLEAVTVSVILKATIVKVYFIFLRPNVQSESFKLQKTLSLGLLAVGNSPFFFCNSDQCYTKKIWCHYCLKGREEKHYSVQAGCDVVWEIDLSFLVSWNIYVTAMRRIILCKCSKNQNNIYTSMNEPQPGLPGK